MGLLKRIIVILGSLLLGIYFPNTQHLYSEDTGYKYFKNYSYKDYDHYPQNWGITQAKNGIIYVANQAGVLEFDGVSWRVIYEDIPNKTVRSLAIDEAGTIYIGGNDEIGHLSPDAKGALKYVSLVDHLEKKYKNFSIVWRTHAAKEGIYFRTSKFLFRWNAQKMTVWENRSFRASFVCKGKFFVQQEKVGLMQVINDSLKLIPGGEAFAHEKIWMMVPYDTKKNSQTLLIGTRAKGFYLYDGRTAQPFTTELDGYLQDNTLYGGIRLSCGDFAMATLQGGVVFMDNQGRLKYIFDKTSGLQCKSVKSLFEDSQGNLWAALDDGISKIEYASPFFLFDDRCGLPGLVLSVTWHQGDLFTGTSMGLYVLRLHSRAFHPIPGISSECWSLLSIDFSILAAANDGVYQVDNKNNIKRKVIEDMSFVLLPSQRYTGHIWCGTNKGLVALIQEKGRWIERRRYKNIDQEVRYIAEDKKGSLWLVTNTGGVLKVDFRDNNNIENPVVTWYETSHGLPGGRVYTSVAAGHVMFATERGIFRFDEKKNAFIPDRTLGNQFAGGLVSKPVFRISEDKNKNIWFHSESRNYLAVPGAKGPFKLHFKPFLRLPIAQVNTIYPDPDGKNVWFGSIEGLIRCDTRVKKNYDLPFHTLIRKVLVNGKPVFAGYRKRSEIKETYTVIDYNKDRNLRFEFASPFFEAEAETTYQYLLQGYDKKWNAWNKETWKDYTNLDSGINIFRVRAKNVYGTISSEAVFRFKILLPWYRTWWAFLSYVFILSMMTYLIIKWQRSIKLEKEKQRLEEIVKKRTIEIREKNLQLLEQSEKLKEMDKVKSRFFANISHEFRTPLTLIMSPLEQMLSDSDKKNQKNTLKVMLRNSRHLLTLINQLLDLSRFDSGKMKLHASKQNIVPFLKGALASFHMLARKNKLKLAFQTEKEDIPLYFDAQKLEEAINNLLFNAVKFTPAGGKITVSVSLSPNPDTADQEGNFVEISVSDTGIGIPGERLEHIFDRFYQAESHHEKAFKGTGIGLALTREIVLIHHGKIDVHSQEGKGTEFVIQLPSGNKHLEPQEIVTLPETESEPKEDKKMQTLYIDDTEEEGDDTAEIVESPEEAEPEITTGQTSEDESRAQETNVILVVEDHPDMRRHIRDSLKSLYNVVEAKDGKEGIERAKEIIPDLIVSDIMMPEKDGYELCLELKKNIKTSHIPIILLTAKASEESTIYGLETGADDYITKPFNTKILLTRIKNLIELRSHLQQKIQKQMLLQPSEISVSSMDQEFIKELHDVIEKNLSDPEFHVEQLSEKLYMDRTTLYRKIMALTGESPTEFIRSYRLKRAAQLLRDKFGTVSQVSLEVGFSNFAYFAKCFKEKFHQLPSSYQASG